MGQRTARNCAGGGLAVEVYLSFEHFLCLSSALWIIKIQAHSNSTPTVVIFNITFSSLKSPCDAHCVGLQSLSAPWLLFRSGLWVPPDVMKDLLLPGIIKVL